MVDVVCHFIQNKWDKALCYLDIEANAFYSKQKLKMNVISFSPIISRCHLASISKSPAALLSVDKRNWVSFRNSKRGGKVKNQISHVFSSPKPGGVVLEHFFFLFPINCQKWMNVIPMRNLWINVKSECFDGGKIMKSPWVVVISALFFRLLVAVCFLNSFYLTLYFIKSCSVASACIFVVFLMCKPIDHTETVLVRSLCLL